MSQTHMLIVAIPPAFDITAFMSPREHAGFFRNENAVTDEIKAISQSITESAISFFPSIRIHSDSINALVQLLDDLKLVVDIRTLPGLLRTDETPFEHTCLTVINIFPFHNKDLLRPYVERAVELENCCIEVQNL